MKRSTSTPTRFIFKGDEKRAQQFTGLARKLLGGVEAQKARRGAGFRSRSVTLDTGETINITSMRGMANIEIIAPGKAGIEAVQYEAAPEEELVSALGEILCEGQSQTLGDWVKGHFGHKDVSIVYRTEIALAKGFIIVGHVIFVGWQRTAMLTAKKPVYACDAGSPACVLFYEDYDMGNVEGPYEWLTDELGSGDPNYRGEPWNCED